MGKSGGDRVGAARRSKRGSPEDVQNTATAKTAADGALQQEAERLRDELAAERQRAQDLETANNRVAARLEAMIKSVKAILGKRG